jgi:hypothetical protein
MPNLAIELTHLEEADRHIALARRNLSLVENFEPASPLPDGHEKRLNTLRQTLAAFEAHRAQIVKMIEGLRDGSLPAG